MATEHEERILRTLMDIATTLKEMKTELTVISTNTKYTNINLGNLVKFTLEKQKQ